MQNIIAFAVAWLMLLGSTAAQTQTDEWGTTVLTGPDGAMLPLMAAPLQRAHFSPDERIIIYKAHPGSDAWEKVVEITFPENSESFSKHLGSELIEQIKSDFSLQTDEEVYQFYAGEPIEKIGMYAFVREYMEAFGLIYIDRSWEPGEHVRYRIEAHLGESLNGRLELSADAAFTNYPDQYAIHNYLLSDSLVTVSWTTPSSTFKETIGLQADVFKQLNDDKFHRLQTSLVTRAADSDSSFIHLQDPVEPGLRYAYYVRLADWVGNIGYPTDTLYALAYDAGNVSPITELRAEVGQTGVQLSWNPLPAEAIYTGIAIHKSRNYDSAYVVLDTIAAHEVGYLDNRVLAGSMYYYRVKPIFLHNADDEFIKPAEVAAVADIPAGNLPPLPPQGVRATAADEGVKISWWVPDGLDTYGFYVLRGTTLDRMDIISSTVQDTVYTDSLLIAGYSGQLHYAVIAMSHSQLLSDTSQVVTVAVRQPQVLTPPGGLVSQGILQGINLSWNNVMEIDDRVTGYAIFRRDEESDQFDILKDNWNLPVYSDTTALAGTEYTYAVSTRDVWGNFSVISSLSQAERTAFDATLEPPLLINVRNLSSGIDVSWPISLTTPHIEYAIYRKADDEEEFRQVGTAVANRSFIDKHVISGVTYAYYVVAVSDGLEGEPGPTLRISRQ